MNIEDNAFKFFDLYGSGESLQAFAKEIRDYHDAMLLMKLSGEEDKGDFAYMVREVESLRQRLNWTIDSMVKTMETIRDGKSFIHPEKDEEEES